MKKLSSFAIFESQKIESSHAKKMLGGVADSSSSSSTTKSTADFGCTESTTTTVTDGRNGDKTITVTSTQTCPPGC